MHCVKSLNSREKLREFLKFLETGQVQIEIELL